MTTSTTPSLVEALRRTVAQHTNSVAIATADKDITFQTFEELSNMLAAGLADKGIKKGDRIGLYCINADVFAIAYFGIIKAGAVALPLNLLLPPADLAYILNNAGANGLIYHALFSENVAALHNDVTTLEHMFVIGEDPNQAADSLQTILEQDGRPPEIAFSPADDVASLIYTSGTTGRPKGVMLTHRNLLANTQACVEVLKLQPGKDRFFVVLPMFHSFAHTAGMLLPLLHGCSFVPFPKFDIQLVADGIAQSGATIFLGVPTMYGMLLDLAEQDTPRLSSLRYCVSGGAAMPMSIMQRFEDRFDKLIYEGDGPTECGPVTCLNPIDGKRKPGSVGLPLPSVEMEIRSDEGEPLADKEIGEICVRGPSVMKGYWQNPEATAEAFFDEWYRTGDLGYRDTEGYFYIVDRLKDMLIVNGMNVYPKMVEEVLYQCPGIKEAAVVGEHDELHGEIPVAYVACAADSKLTEQDVVQFCEGRLAKFQQPRHVRFMDSLPKTPTGKILKRELRKQGERERGIAPA